MVDYELVFTNVYDDYCSFGDPPREVHVEVYRADDPSMSEPVARVRFSYLMWKKMFLVDESLESQIERLAQFILDEVPGEPSQSQGAVDTAIRVIRELQLNQRNASAG